MSNVYELHTSSSYSPWSRGAKELIAEYWSRQGKKKGDKAGRKSDPKPKVAGRRPVADSVETTPERTQAPKKRGRDRPKAKPDSDDEGDGEEEDTRSRKGGGRALAPLKSVSLPSIVLRQG